MNTKRYIVALNKNVDYDAFWQEMEDPTSGLPHIPDRAVGIANNRDMFKRICEYWLTDSEAAKVKNDPRVAGVEIPVEDNPNVGIVSQTTQNIPGMNYTKQAGNITIDYTTGDFTSFDPANYTPPLDASTNWGLIRHSFQSNPYGPNPTGSTNSTTSEYYNYALDGTNVDVIINDTGIQADHPEFAGRVVEVDWDSIAEEVGAYYTLGWNTVSYTDTDGHGTNVAGIAAGATYGWAKGANIIPLYLSVAGTSAADPLDTFSMMIYWHQNKGTTNPTIVNMSWDLRFNFNSPYDQGMSYCNYYFSGGSYQGSTWAGAQTDSFFQDRGLIALTGNGWPGQGPVLSFPYSSAAYNAALAEVIDAGIIVCQAAGNNGFKIDVSGGDDYDNYVTSIDDYYYNRGASPKDPRAIVVGALDTKTSASAQDQRVEFSCAGPGVDIWAAGTYIMSAGCTNPNPVTSAQYGNDYAYYLNGLFNEFTDTGTSQASPQITGMGALYLQANPPDNIYDPDNCSTVKSWLINNATTDTFYATGNATSYTDGLSLLGGEPKVAYQPLQPINIDAVEVFVGGIRVETGYTVINTNPVQVQFDEAPPSGVDVTILVRRGVTWYAPGIATASDGNPLQITETGAARFLRGL